MPSIRGSRRLRRPTASALVSGPRVCLRRPSARDAQTVLSLMRGSRGFHLPWIDEMEGAEAFGGYLRKIRGARHKGLLVCRAEDGEPMGLINLNEIVRARLQSAYLGYWIGKDFAGQGYMTDALRLAMRYASKELKLHRLEAAIQPGNRASIALVLRCGFRKEGFSPRYLKIRGRWRDHERWAVLLEDSS